MRKSPSPFSHKIVAENISLKVLNLKNSIDFRGFEQDDIHLNRKVISNTDFAYYLNRSEFSDFLSLDVEKKYDDDYERMKSDMQWVCDKAKVDPDSRQLIVTNTNNFLTIPCFNLIQFVRGTDRNFMGGNPHKPIDDKFKMIVTQRSQDLKKWPQDIRFFLKLVEEFESKTGKTVEVICIHYGNIHYEKE